MRNHRSVLVATVGVVVDLLSLERSMSVQSGLSPRRRGTIEVSIGDGGVDDDATFGRISGRAIDAAGRSFVANSQDL